MGLICYFYGMKNFIAICLCLLFVNLTFVGHAANEAKTTKNVIVKTFDFKVVDSVKIEKITNDSLFLFDDIDTLEMIPGDVYGMDSVSLLDANTGKIRSVNRNYNHSFKPILFATNDPEIIDLSFKRYSTNNNSFINRNSKSKRSGYKSNKRFARLYPKS